MRIDAQCSRCKARYFWYGEPESWIACPRCGHLEPQDDVQNDVQTLNEFKDFLRERKQARDIKSL